MSMDCSRRRKSSFSGDEELRKMSRVWIQDPVSGNPVEQQQQQQQHILQRLHQHELVSHQTTPLSMQQRAMAAIALQEIRSSIDPAKQQHQQQQQCQQQNQQHCQQQQQQQVSNQAQVQAQLLHQKYQHLVHQQLKPAMPGSPLQMVDTRYTVHHHQIPGGSMVHHGMVNVVSPPPLTPPPPPPPPLPSLETSPSPMVDPSPKLIQVPPPSPQMMNIPPVIFPSTLTPSTPPPRGLLQTSSLQLCPNLGVPEALQQAKTAWFSSSSHSGGGPLDSLPQPVQLRGVSPGGSGGTNTATSTTTTVTTGTPTSMSLTGSMGGIYCQDSRANLGGGLEEYHHQQKQQQTHHQQQQQQQQHLQQVSCEHELDSPGFNCGVTTSFKVNGSLSSGMIMPPPPPPPPPPVATGATAYNQTSNNNNNNNNNTLRPITNAQTGDQMSMMNPEAALKSTSAGGGGGGGSNNMVFQENCVPGEKPIQGRVLSPGQRPPPTRTFTKVYKLGSIGRAVDVARFKNYVELRAELSRMFGLDGQLDQRNGWQLVFVDKENDLLLVGDDPWEEFVSSVRGIRILSPSEVSYYTSDERGGEPV